MSQSYKDNVYQLSEITTLAPGEKIEWVYEDDYGGEQHLYKIENTIAMGETEFQSYAIFDTTAFGIVLFLDGYIQSAQKDEFIYHESLVQPAMLAHPNPKKVLVIGAGEGATGREILYHPTVEQVVLIDLDKELIDLVRKHLKPIHQGAFDHPKVEVVFEDGYSYLKNSQEKFDVIIIDVVDAIEEGPAQKLYTREFYQFLKTDCLTKDGIVVVQSMEMNELDSRDDWHVYREMTHSFKHVCSYSSFVASFWAKWRYTIASDVIDANTITESQIDSVVSQRGIDKKLLYIDGETFCTMRGMSKIARKLLTKALNNQHSSNQEADLSDHFIDWDPDAHRSLFKNKMLD